MRLRSNPAQLPLNPVVYSYSNDYGMYWIHLWDGLEFIGGLQLIDNHGVYAAYAAAKEGYGPVLYHTAAYVLGLAITPSGSLSPMAFQFWERNNQRINPMLREEFIKVWGFDPDDVMAPGKPNDKDRRFMETSVIMYGSYKSMPHYASIEFPHDKNGLTVEQQMVKLDDERRAKLKR